MKLIKYFVAAVLFILCLPMAGQTSYEELEFEPDSVTAPYKPSGKNYVLIRSKRGTGGVNKTPAADAILSAEVTEIVLVFSETDPSDLADREQSNQERWENLLKTYPELFQFSTTYKNLCQCKAGGDAEAFKQSQGFYVYINGEVPKVAAEAPKAEEPKVAATPPATQPAKTEEKKAEKAEEKKAIEKEAVAEKETASKQVAAADNTAVKAKEAPPVVNEKQESTPPAATSSQEKTTSSATEAAAPKKKVAANLKPRRTKDPKACRPACYGSGDEDLDAFFRDNLKLSKKQRKVAKKQPVVIKLQLNVDGSIKKTLVTCPDEKLNLLVTEAVKSMNPWNATVKSGVTVKSEVKITLKYDKATKSLKSSEVAVTPRQALKCKCASDAELFD